MSVKKGFLLIFVLAFVLAACGGADYSEDARSNAAEAPMAAPMDMADDGEAYYDEGADYDMVNADGSGFATGSTASASVEQQAQIPNERLIIRTADLNIIVADTEAAIGTISEMVEANGGWVVNSGVYQYRDDAKSGNITVRVPVEGFNSAIEAVKGLAVEVSSESTSGQDVTEEFVDLSSRLGNLEATADRVRNFLDESKNVEEALAVNQELSRLEGEIEVIKGRMQFLSQSASYSTITVNLTPDIATQPISPETWQPGVVANRAIEALVNALQGIANFAIGFAIYFLPLALIVGVPSWLIGRLALRRWRRRGQQPVAASEPTAVS
jgi:hypothetical protein